MSERESSWESVIVGQTSPRPRHGSAERLHRVFEEVEEIGPPSNRLGVRNQSSRQTIFLCRGPRGDWPDLWPLLRAVS